MGRNSKNSEIRTLNTVLDLRDVKFGHRFPRHGLKLLHWLANNMVKFDNTKRMWIQQNPENGDFGFHRFRNSERILPDPPFQSSYFEVGNLRATGAQSLLFGEDQPGNSESNTDRIILSLDSKMLIGSVYITEHTPHNLQFSAKDTYLLSNNLIWSIKGKPMDHFMRQAGYVPGVNKRALNERALNERALNERVLNERVLNERALNERALNERALNKRALNERALNERVLNERALNERALNERALNERALNKRALNERALNERALNERALNESVSIHIPEESSATFSVDEEDSCCSCCIIL